MFCEEGHGKYFDANWCVWHWMPISVHEACFHKIQYPPPWESSRHNHIMTGRDNSCPEPLIAKSFPSPHVSIFASLLGTQHEGWGKYPPSPSLVTLACHRGGFTVILKEKFCFVLAQRPMDGRSAFSTPVWYYSLTWYRGGVCAWWRPHPVPSTFCKCH